MTMMLMPPTHNNTQLCFAKITNWAVGYNGSGNLKWFDLNTNIEWLVFYFVFEGYYKVTNKNIFIL